MEGLTEQGGLQPGETLDDLQVGGLRIIQRRDGYRFSLDPVLLCAFAAIGANARVADLGTGSGVMPLLLARQGKGRSFLGLERQAELAERARRSVVLNGLTDRIEVRCLDVRMVSAQLPPQSFDVVVANPPFRAVGSGRVAPDDERAAARHELAGGLDDFIAAAAWLLGSGGRLYLVFLVERLVELLAALRAQRFEPKRLRLVHGRQAEAARMVLVEARRDGQPGLTVEPPLIVYRGEGRDYTPELQLIYGQQSSEGGSR